MVSLSVAHQQLMAQSWGHLAEPRTQNGSIQVHRESRMTTETTTYSLHYAHITHIKNLVKCVCVCVCVFVCVFVYV